MWSACICFFISHLQLCPSSFQQLCPSSHLQLCLSSRSQLCLSSHLHLNPSSHLQLRPPFLLQQPRNPPRPHLRHPRINSARIIANPEPHPPIRPRATPHQKLTLPGAHTHPQSSIIHHKIFRPLLHLLQVIFASPKIPSQTPHAANSTRRPRPAPCAQLPLRRLEPQTPSQMRG